MAVSGAKEFQVEAAPADVMAAIAAVDRLPEWSSAHKKVIVESTHADGRPCRVRMTVSIMGINDEQVVDYSWDGDTACPGPWSRARSRTVRTVPTRSPRRATAHS